MPEDGVESLPCGCGRGDGLRLFLDHLVFVQYTVTAALLCAAAAFLFATSGTGECHKAGKGFVKKNIPSILLAVLAFCLRTE